MSIISKIKTLVDLNDVANKFNIHFPEITGRSYCPFCGSDRFYNNRNENYNCLACERKGDIINLLLDTNKAVDTKSAIKAIVEEFNLSGINLRESDKHQTIGRRQVFEYYQKAAITYKDIVAKAYTDRGWTLKDDELIGYCPCDGFLQEQGFDKSTLKHLGLYYDNFEHIHCSALVFPILSFSSSGINHFAARNIDSHEQLRWILTTGDPPITEYFYNEQSLDQSDYLFICEGISDARSLIEINEPVIGTFGINTKFNPIYDQLRNKRFITAIFDRDTFPRRTKREGEFISWSAMLPHLTELAIATNVPIYCVMPPNEAGIKDTNDWLMSIQYDKEQFKQYVSMYSERLDDFLFRLYGHDPKWHPLMWRLAAAWDVENEGLIESITDWKTYMRNYHF